MVRFFQKTLLLVILEMTFPIFSCCLQKKLIWKSYTTDLWPQLQIKMRSNPLQNYLSTQTPLRELLVTLILIHLRLFSRNYMAAIIISFLSFLVSRQCFETVCTKNHRSHNLASTYFKQKKPPITYILS